MYSQQAVLAPRENSSVGDESGEGQAPSPAVKSQSTSSEDDKSGGEGHFGGDGLDDIDGIPRRRNTGSGTKLNVPLLTRSAPTGKAWW